MKTSFPRRFQRSSTGCILALSLLGAGLSCGYFPKSEEAPKPKAQRLQEAELPLLMTRLGQYPRRVVSPSSRVAIRCYFDPELVDMKLLDRCCIWQQDPETLLWKKIGTAPMSAQPIDAEFGEGLVGLWASAIDELGMEHLLPRIGDVPALWLCVDRSAPVLSWVEPKQNAALTGLRALDLKWSASDLQFGPDPLRLEWSADGGRSWKPIASLPAADGIGSYSWKLPPDVCSDIQVRMACRDMAGFESSAVVELTYPGSVGSRRPAPAAPESGGAVASTRAPAASSPAPATAAGDAAGVATTSGEISGSAPRAATAADTALPGGPAGQPGPVGEGALAAAGAAGTDTAPAKTFAPGAAPAKTFAPGAAPATPPEAGAGGGEFRLLPTASTVVRGGAKVPISWQYDGTATNGSVRIEWSGDGGQTWSPAGTASLADGNMEWTTPLESGTGYLVRATAEIEGGGRLESILVGGLSLDADPPLVSIGEVPWTVGPQAQLPLALSDPGASGIERVDVYVRADAAGPWQPIPPERACLEGSSLKVDLGDLPEGVVEVAVRASDRVGNASPEPSPEAVGDSGGAAARSRIKLQLDRTPPVLRASRGPAPWVSGFRTEIQVQANWSDAVLPLIAEGRAAGETWTELARWTTVAPNETSFPVDIPQGSVAYTVRFSAADAAGNLGHATVGPESVRPPLRLLSFRERKAFTAGTMARIEWELDPVAAEVEDELKIHVAHLRGREGNWQLIREISPREQYLWELPEADKEEHRLRLRLFRSGKAIGEDISEPFTIVSDGMAVPVVVNIASDSSYYSNQARSRMEQYFSLLGRGDSAASAVELGRLRKEVEGGFARALEIDKNNHDAAYGMAQFLNRLDSSGNAPQVLQWLLETVRVKPDHAWALNDLGAYYIREGQFDKAEEYLRRSAQAQSSPVILYNLGLSLFYGNKLKEAREKLEAALQPGEGTAAVSPGEVYYYLIQAYALGGDLDTARALYRKQEGAIPAELRGELARAIQG